MVVGRYTFMLTATIGFKIFKSKQVEVHCSFLEPVTLELKLAVFNFFPIFGRLSFVLDFFLILEHRCQF